MTTRAAPDTLARWSAVLDPATLEAELRGLPADPWGWGVPRSVRVRVIKPHQRRCVFQATLETGGGARTLIGKAYARDRSDIANAMAAFVAAGVGLDDGCSIPLPYAHLPALGVRLEEYVTGPVAETVMLQGAPADRRAAARRCGRWLARFQRKAPRLAGKILDLSVERERWRTWADELAGAGGVLADKARRLLALVERALPPAGSIPTAAAHGSYIAEHVVLSGRRTAAIDFDEYGIADPDREVAWFIISLQRSALKVLGSFHALDPLTAEFLQGYGAEKGSDRLPRVALYRGIECLHRGRRDLVGRVPSAPEWAELMVDEGLRALTTTEAS